MIAAALLAAVLTAQPTHVWNVTEAMPSIYVTHSETPDWALPGDGPLWHWHDKQRGWRQLRGTKAQYLAARYRNRPARRRCVT